MAAGGRRALLRLSDREFGALTRAAHGPGNGRVLQCCFGPGAVWVDPQVRDGQGRYPRWIVLRLAVLRGLDVTWLDVTEEEMRELEEFAAQCEVGIVCPT